MPDYRRWYQPGGTWFFTVNLLDRRSSTLVDHTDLLRRAFRRVRAKYPFDMLAIVVLPNHLHCIWTLPPNDADFSKRWRLIKARFSRELSGHGPGSRSRCKRRERGVWQRRFWEHSIRDENDLNRHINYIHYNPVKHGLLPSPIDWPHSSFHRYVRLGILPTHWSADRTIRALDFG